MLARYLRWLTALELGGAALIAAALMDAAWPVPVAIAVSLAIPLFAHALIITTEFALAASLGGLAPAEHRLDAWQFARLIGREVVESIRAFQFEQPWRADAPSADCADRQPAGLPVLLLHGYCCNQRIWRHLRPWLRARGHPVHAVDLEPVFGDIDDYVDRIDNGVKALCERSGAPRVVLLAHSMGGLAARAYLRRHGGQAVAALITLGSPHQGTALARFGQGMNARQMRPGSLWLTRLARDEAGRPPGDQVPVTVIVSHHDNLLAPRMPQDLPASRCVEVAGIGHLELVSSARVRQAIGAALDAAVAPGADQPSQARSAEPIGARSGSLA